MDAPLLSDAELLRRHRQGDAEAFGRLRERHAQLVYATCLRVAGDAALAEDAAQAVFLLVDRKADRLVNHPSLTGWLHTAARHAARNLAREEVRRRRREREAFAPPVSDGLWAGIAPVLDDVLGRLPAGDREAILLRFGHDRSLAEVGAALGVGENAARMRVSRALERLREGLRRAGVAVPVAALAGLLGSRLAEAAVPVAVVRGAVPSLRTAATATRLAAALTPSPLLWFGAGGVALIAATIGLVYLVRPAEAALVPPGEAARRFALAQGEWRGRLEYVDDRTGIPNGYPTQVRVTAASDRLHIVARYTGAANVDETLFQRRGDGGYEVRNGGPAASHTLDGQYTLVRQGLNAAFVGFSQRLGREVRLTLSTAPNRLTLTEEVRRPGEPYRLRNRFTLER